MTRYDPFSYGQVRLGSKQAPAADSPDDLLFADAGPKAAAPPAADSSWALLEENVDNLLPSAGATAPALEFGTDILGEAPVPPPASAPPATRPRPAAAKQPPPRPGRVDAGGAKAVLGPPSAGAETAKEVRAKQKPVGPVASNPPAVVAAVPSALVLPRRRARPIAGILVPFVLCAGGGTAAFWFAITQQNPVMAGIVGLLAVVSAAFTWLSMRP